MLMVVRYVEFSDVTVSCFSGCERAEGDRAVIKPTWIKGSVKMWEIDEDG